MLLCYLLNVKVEIPTPDNIKQFIPSHLISYSILAENYYKSLKNSSQVYIEQIVNFKQFNFETNFVGATSTLGFLLQVFLVLGEKFSNWWKANEMLVWMLLFITSSVPLNNAYAGQIKVLQVRIIISYVNDFEFLKLFVVNFLLKFDYIFINFWVNMDQTL